MEHVAQASRLLCHQACRYRQDQGLMLCQGRISDSIEYVTCDTAVVEACPNLTQTWVYGVRLVSCWFLFHRLRIDHWSSRGTRRGCCLYSTVPVLGFLRARTPHLGAFVVHATQVTITCHHSSPLSLHYKVHLPHIMAPPSISSSLPSQNKKTAGRRAPFVSCPLQPQY